MASELGVFLFVIKCYSLWVQEYARLVVSWKLFKYFIHVIYPFSLCYFLSVSILYSKKLFPLHPVFDSSLVPLQLVGSIFCPNFRRSFLVLFQPVSDGTLIYFFHLCFQTRLRLSFFFTWFPVCFTFLSNFTCYRSFFTCPSSLIVT